MSTYYAYNSDSYSNHAPVKRLPQPMPTDVPSPDTSAVVRMRVCDLRILSGHTAASSSVGIGGSGDSGSSANGFCVDGLYVVVRLGSQVGRTEPLAFTESLVNEGTVDIYRCDANEEDDEDFLLFDSGARVESTLSCLVWNEVFEFYPDREDAGAGGAFGTADRLVSAIPSVDVELWRSTRTAERCIGRYSYNVPIEALSFLSSQDARRQAKWSAGNAPPHEVAGLSKSTTAADASAIVDKVVPLRMAAGTPAGNSPSLAGNSNSSGAVFPSYPARGGSHQSAGGRSSATPVRLGLRLRVSAVGVPLPTHSPVSPASGTGILAVPECAPVFTGPVPAYDRYPHLTAADGLGYLGGMQSVCAGMGSLHGNGGGVAAYGLLSGAGLMYSDGNPNRLPFGPRTPAAYENGYAVSQGPFHHGALGMADNTGGGGVLDPFLSRLLTPMALRSSFMTRSPHTVSVTPASSRTSPQQIMYGGAVAQGVGGVPPPLTMPDTTLAVGIQGSGYAPYTFHPQPSQGLMYPSTRNMGLLDGDADRGSG